MTTLNANTSMKIRLPLAAAIVAGFVGTSAASAHEEMGSCVRNLNGDKYLVICKDGVFSEDVTTQSVGAVAATSKTSDAHIASRRFRYEDF